MGFAKPPLLRVREQDDQWELAEPLVYVSKAGEVITIPEKFTTDLASIPRPLQGLVNVNGKHRAAAILHDYLYTVRGRSRSECDSLFLEAMESVGVRWSQRWVMYLAVRVGGWTFWL